ncbi:MAG: sigma-54-dependent transcriptional regulator [Candidatus Binatia bacterium]
MKGNILIVEDEALPRKNICRVLTEEGYSVHEAADGVEAMETVDSTDFDLVLTDIKMPKADGIAVLKHVRKVAPQTFVAMMTAYASVETAVTALQLGAHDYLLKPIVYEDLLRKISLLLEYKQQAWEVQVLRRQLNQDADTQDLVGSSPPMCKVTTIIDKIAPTNVTVLITGESGVGKEVVARAIHMRSTRHSNIFLPINCSAIPEPLLESQLFGHVKGAFTGATSASEGLFQRARGGTVFLDEIGEMPVSLQPKLLRVLEAKEVLPVGATTPIRIDARILAATNRDLEKEVEAGRFREDLFYRVNVVRVPLPPLRERREDIPLLVEHIVRKHNQEMKTNYKGVENNAMRILLTLPWKGNVRELDNVLERAMILGDGEWISEMDLPESPQVASEPAGIQTTGYDLRTAVNACEKNHIENVLKVTEGDRTRAAELLGVSRSSLYRKLEQLGVPLEDV